MKTNSMTPIRTAVTSIAMIFLAGGGAVFAQDQPAAPPPDGQQQTAPSNGAWRRTDDPAPAQSAQAQTPPAQPTEPQSAPATPPPDAAPPADAGPRSTMDPNYSQGPGAPPPAYPSQGGYPNQGAYPSQGGYPNQGAYPNQGGYPPYPNQPYPNQYPNQYPPNQRYGSQPPAANYNRGPVPGSLTIKPGTYVTVRLNQGLSSDRNHIGDAFAATLAQPLIVDGVVVAERGQTVGGKVTEAKKAGRVEGTSRLAVQLSDLTLADGQAVPIQTQLVSKNGATSVGRDVGAVGATTATGAAIGAAADWGRGAAIGAGVGALAGIVGVLVTRGRPTYLYPEQLLTFRVETPVTVSTEKTQQAFRWANQGDYRPSMSMGGPSRMGAPNGAYYSYGPNPYAYAYPYAYGYGYGYPYYWGPRAGFYLGGRGWWGRRWR